VRWVLTLSPSRFRFARSRWSCEAVAVVLREDYRVQVGRETVRLWLRDAGLVYDLLVLPHQLPAATAAVRALPDLTFVLDHLAKPPIAAGQREPWATELATLAREPNVVAKFSGLVTEAGRPWRVEDLRPYADTALAAFGPDRLMLGSDWPVCLLAGTYAEVMAAADSLLDGLAPAEQDAVRGGTATRVYGLAP